MKRHIILFAVITLACIDCFAQKQDGYSESSSSDFRARAAVTLGYKPSKNWDLSFNAEVRGCDNLRKFDRVYLTAGASYSPFRHFKILGSYTFGDLYKTDPTEWIMRHRLSGGASYTIPVGNFRFSIRELVQCTWNRDSVNTAEKANPTLRLRSRLRVSYDTPVQPITVYVGFELFNTLNAPYADLSDLNVLSGNKPESIKNYISRYRAAAGLKYKFNAHTSIEGYYRFDDNINYDINIGKKSGKVNRVEKETEFRHIVGVELIHYF